MKQGRVFILEGVNGTGKTTLSRALAAELGAVIIRPFHNANPDSHWGQTLDPEECMLRAVGVPIQTPADDMYVADMLAKMKPPIAICDRSLITGMAYGDFDKDPRVHVKDSAREYWAGLLNKHHHSILIHLVADFDTCVKRCAAEGRHKHRERAEWDKLVGRYYTEVEMAGEYMDEVYHINTSDINVEQALTIILGSQRWTQGGDDAPSERANKGQD